MVTVMSTGQVGQQCKVRRWVPAQEQWTIWKEGVVVGKVKTKTAVSILISLCVIYSAYLGHMCVFYDDVDV